MNARGICANFLGPIGDTIAVGLCLCRSFAIGEDSGSTGKSSIEHTEEALQLTLLLNLAKDGAKKWNSGIADLIKGREFIDFRNAKISADVSFVGGFHFPIDVDFSKATFEGDVEFTDATFHKKAKFRDATFKGGVRFHAVKFGGFANFYDTTFCGAAYFNGRDGGEGAKFKEPPWFKSEKVPADFYFNDIEDFSKQFPDPVDSEEEKEFAEANYRQLKLAMKRLEAHAEENAFARLEMRAYQRKAPSHTKWLYGLYGLTSDYGQSVLRSFLWWLAFIIVFWGISIGLKCLSCNLLGCDCVLDALQVALRGALPFPGIFPDEFGKLHGWKNVSIALHRIFSASLWFLALLAIRNRFRLK